MQSVCTCACKREHGIKCARDAHIYTFALSRDCCRSRWQRRDDYDDWRPNLKTTNHTCRGRSVLQKRPIAVQGRPSSSPIRLRKMYVGVLIRERGKKELTRPPWWFCGMRRGSRRAARWPLMSAVSPLLLQDPDKLQEEKLKFVYNDHTAAWKLLRSGGSGGAGVYLRVGQSQGYTLDRSSVHHTFTHTLTPRGNLESSVNLMSPFLNCGRELEKTQREDWENVHAQSPEPSC